MNSGYRNRKFEKAVLVSLWFIYVLWFFRFMRKGIDVSDQAYVLTKYKYFFDFAPESRHFDTVMTDFVGAFIYRALPSHQALAFVALGWLTYLMSGVMIYNTLKRRVSRIPLLTAMIAGSLFSMTWGRYFSYNAASMVIQTAAICVLIKALERDSDRLIFAAGIIIGLNTLFRLPNILQTGFGAAIIWHCIISGMPAGKAAKRCGIGLLGIVLGWLPTGIVAVKYLGFERVKEGLAAAAGILGNNEAKHGSSHMLSKLVTGLKRGAVLDRNFLLPVIAIALAAALICYVVKDERRRSYVAVISWIAIAAYAVYWSFGMREETKAFDVLCMFAAASVCTLLPAVIYYIKSDKVLSAASLIILIAELILFVGTANGLTHQMVFMMAPAAGCIMVVENIRGILPAGVARGLAVGMGTLVLFVGIGYATTYVYRDAPNSQLKYEVSSKAYAGMLTSEERADYMDDAARILRMTDADTLLSVGYSFNSPYIISDKRPAVKRIWLDLDIYTREALLADLEEGIRRDGMPAVLMANAELGVGNNDLKKRELLLEFVEKNKYELAYRDGWFTLYTPIG